jgi:hypothetical protein
MKLVEQFHKK